MTLARKISLYGSHALNAAGGAALNAYLNHLKVHA